MKLLTKTERDDILRSRHNMDIMTLIYLGGITALITWQQFNSIFWSVFAFFGAWCYPLAHNIYRHFFERVKK